MIREEDVLSLQTAVLKAVLARTVPGEKYLDLAGFREFVGAEFDDAALREMLKELVAEGILQEKPGAEAYCASQEYLASVAEAS